MSSNPIGGITPDNQALTTCAVADSWNREYADPVCDGLTKTRNQSSQGPSFSVTNLALMPQYRTPGGKEQFTNCIPPVPGSQISRRGQAGTTYYEITGQCSYVMNNIPTPGNSTNSVSDFAVEIQRLLKKPGLGRKTVKGAEVVNLIEKGLYSLAQNKGLPSSGALSQMTGHVQEQLKNIETAVQQFSQIPGLGFSMPSFGSAMNLSNLLKKINKKQKKKLESSVQPEILDAITSMLDYISMSSSESFMSSGTIDEETFLENAVEMLSQVTDLNELTSALEALQNDTTLHGLDKFKNLEVKIETVFGELKLNVDVKGNIGFNVDSLKKLTSSLGSLTSIMNSISSAGLDKLFGNAASVMNELDRRVGENGGSDIVSKLKSVLPQCTTASKCANGAYPWT